MAKKRSKNKGGNVAQVAGTSGGVKRTSAPQFNFKKKEGSEEKSSLQTFMVATIGYGLVGLIVGLLTGLNELAQVPSEVASNPLEHLFWMGEQVGATTLSWSSGLLLGLVGLMVGAGFGALLKLPPRNLVLGLIMLFFAGYGLSNLIGIQGFGVSALLVVTYFYKDILSEIQGDSEKKG